MRRAVSDADKGARRAELLAAARTAFADKGYHGTTMADVARAAGLSYGVAYWYFDSKDDLFKAAMSEEAEALRASIAAALEVQRAARAGGSGTTVAATDLVREGLEAAVSAAFAHFDAEPAAGALLFREPFVLGADFERHLVDIYGGFIAEINTVVADAQRRGTLRHAPVELVGFAIASLISSMAMRRLRTDDGLSATEAARFVVGVALEGVAARSPEANPRAS